jgi:biopolymer transport protein ExbD
VRYQSVVDVLVTLQQANIESVGLVTEPGEQQ